jgi:hypothetical protein
MVVSIVRAANKYAIPRVKVRTPVAGSAKVNGKIAGKEVPELR